MTLFRMNDESKYWHFAYRAEVSRLVRLSEAWSELCAASRARQRAELALVAPYGMRPDPENDGCFIEFDWDTGTYPLPSAEELGAGLRDLIRPSDAEPNGPDELFESVLAGCVLDEQNLGLGPMPSWLELELERALPSHPGVKGMSGWTTTWGERRELLELVARVREKEYFLHVFRRELEDSSDVQQAQDAVTSAMNRLEATAHSGDAVLMVHAKNPLV